MAGSGWRAAALAGGWLADRALGDPARGHPVAGFGRLAAALEPAVWGPSRGRGVLYAGALVAGAAGAVSLVTRLCRRYPVPSVGFGALVVWTTLGGRSLESAGDALAAALEAEDLEGARALLPTLAGRDPRGLDGGELCRAGIESVAENTADAVVGPLFWGAIGGPAAAAAYRAANTLDAMVGHHSDRYEAFGKASARLDDSLTWVPARLSAALAVLLAPCVAISWEPVDGNGPGQGPGSGPAGPLNPRDAGSAAGRTAGCRREAWRVLRRDGAAHPSPNSGRLEAAFAGALGVRLGGTNVYGGRVERRPFIGDGPAPGPEDLRRAVRLSRAVSRAAALLCVVAPILRLVLPMVRARSAPQTARTGW